MILIFLSDTAYENDVHPLVRAFFVHEELKVYGKEDGQFIIKDRDNTASAELSSDRTGSDRAEKTIDHISIDFFNTKVLLSITCVSGAEYKETAETVPETVNKSKYKNAMKRSLYHMLSVITGTGLPWGILTGIRPTKIVYEMLENNCGDDDIREYMREEYLCSDEKISVSIRIAKRELELLRSVDYKSGYSLYIGIPFCPSTCLYCSFPSYSIERFQTHVEDYLNALEKEIRYGAACLPDKKLTTVYFGGGTPTSLSPEQLDRLLGLVKKYFDFTNVKEFCVEAGRPDSITLEKLQVLKKWGVDRISINPQSMQQKTLDLIGRKHTVEQVKEAFHLARQTGFDNINMDMIIGLPGEKPEDVRDTLRQIKELQPESLTVHTLALKRAARLNTEWESYMGLMATGVSDMLKETILFTKENGYFPYYLYRQKNMSDNLENTGYAKHGKEGLYNILIMEEKQTILALGAGAMSKFVFHEENRIERVDNVKSVMDYITRIDEMIERKRIFLSCHQI